MKGLNVKKLAAIGLGAALVGSALAPVASAITLQKSDLVNASGAPVVNVVVGGNAAISDGVWAGNIAAKIAQLATVDTPVQVTSVDVVGATGGGEDTVIMSDGLGALTVDLTLGGTTTVSDADAEVINDDYYSNHLDGTFVAGRTDADSNVLRPTDAYLTDTDLSFLLDKTFDWEFNDTASTQTIKEKVMVVPETKFETDTDVKDLVMYFDSNDVAYVLEFADGLPIYGNNDSTSTADANFVDGDNDYFEVPFFGTTYVLLTTSGLRTSPELRLASDETAKTRLFQGDEVGGLIGKGAYAGETNMSVRLTDVFTSGTVQGSFELYDEAGEIVESADVSTGVFLEDQFKISGDEVLQSSVFVDTLVDDTSDNDTDWARVRSGEDIIRLKAGQEYPYDPNRTDSDEDFWLVAMGVGTHTTLGRVVTSIEIYNNGIDDVTKWDDENPVAALVDGFAPDDYVQNVMFMAGLPDTTPGYGLFSAHFDGFEHDEEEFTLTFGEGEYFEYRDDGKVDHKVPYFFEKLDSTTASGQSKTFDVSDERFYFKLTTTDTNATIASGDNLNGVNITLLRNDTDDSNVLAIQTEFGTDVNTTLVGDHVVIDGIGYRVWDDDNINDFNGGGAILTADGYFEITDNKQIDDAATGDFLKGYKSQTTLNNKFYFDDRNTDLKIAGFGAQPVVELLGKDDEKWLYHYHYTGTASSPNTGDVWLFLDGNTGFLPRFGTLDFNGTDTDEDNVIDHNWYVPHENDLGFTDPNAYNIANFEFLEPSGATGNQVEPGHSRVRVNIDAEDGETPPVEDTTDLPAAALGGSSFEVKFTNVGSGASTALTGLSEYQANDRIQNAWTNHGSSAVLADDVFTMVVPERRLYMDYTVQGESTEVQVVGGDAVEGLTVGEEGRSGDLTVVVNAINGDSTFSATGGAPATNVTEHTVPATATVGPDDVEVVFAPTTAQQVVPVGNLVVADNDPFVGNTPHVIVGGYVVNSLARGLTLSGGNTLEEALQAPGDFVSEKTPGGDFVVAGFTAGDTGTAAQDFIDALDALLG